MVSLVDEAYKIADSNNVILKGSIKISNNTNCLIFAHYCDSTLLYKKFFKISKDVLKVNNIANKNLKEIKNLVKRHHKEFLLAVMQRVKNPTAGGPAVVQWDWCHLGNAGMLVRSQAQHNGFRIWCCHGCSLVL